MVNVPQVAQSRQRKVLARFCFNGIIKYRTMVAFSRAAHQHNYDYAVKYESLNIIIMAVKEWEERGSNVIVRTGCTVGLRLSPVPTHSFTLC